MLAIPPVKVAFGGVEHLIAHLVTNIPTHEALKARAQRLLFHAQEQGPVIAVQDPRLLSSGHYSFNGAIGGDAIAQVETALLIGIGHVAQSISQIDLLGLGTGWTQIVVLPHLGDVKGGAIPLVVAAVLQLGNLRVADVVPHAGQVIGAIIGRALEFGIGPAQVGKHLHAGIAPDPCLVTEAAGQQTLDSKPVDRTRIQQCFLLEATHGVVKFRHIIQVLNQHAILKIKAAFSGVQKVIAKAIIDVQEVILHLAGGTSGQLL